MAAIVHKYRKPLPPPASATPAATWIRESFFSTWYHTVITLALAWAMWEVLSFLVQWALIDATWVGGSAKACAANGGALLGLRRRPLAPVRLRLFPQEEYWRVNIVYALAVATGRVYVFDSGDTSGA